MLSHLHTKHYIRDPLHSFPSTHTSTSSVHLRYYLVSCNLLPPPLLVISTAITPHLRKYHTYNTVLLPIQTTTSIPYYSCTTPLLTECCHEPSSLRHTDRANCLSSPSSVHPLLHFTHDDMLMPVSNITIMLAHRHTYVFQGRSRALR